MGVIEEFKVIKCSNGGSFDNDELRETLHDMAAEAVDDYPPTVFVRFDGKLLSATKASLHRLTDDDGAVMWHIIIEAS